VGIEFEGRNTMKRILIALFCLAGVAAAQTTAPRTEDHEWHQKVIDVKYADPGVLAKLLGDITGNSHDRVNAQRDLHAIAIGTYDPSFLTLAEVIVKRYDVPALASATSHQHGVEIVAHILLAGPKGSSGDALPADLEPVAKQLRSLFGYTDIRLLDSALILGRETKGAEVSGTLNGLAEGQKVPIRYVIQIRSISVEPRTEGNTVALERFKFAAILPYSTVPDKTEFMSLGFDTDLTLRGGQKVVVGKSHIGETKDALILVLSARVVD
jgi:hypothetical protein